MNRIWVSFLALCVGYHGAIITYYEPNRLNYIALVCCLIGLVGAGLRERR